MTLTEARSGFALLLTVFLAGYALRAVQPAAPVPHARCVAVAHGEICTVEFEGFVYTIPRLRREEGR